MNWQFPNISKYKNLDEKTIVNVRRNTDILKRMAMGVYVVKPSESLFEVAHKALRNYQLHNTQINDDYIETLCFYCGKLEDFDQVFFFENVIDRFWFDNCFQFLVYAAVNYWEDKVVKLIRPILKKYAVSEWKKQVCKYLANDGCKKLAEFLFKNRYSVCSATDFLYINHENFTDSYFSYVIKEFYTLKRIDDEKSIKDLYEALNKHNNNTTDKIVLPIAIIKAHRNNCGPETILERYSDDFLKVANERIGDPCDPYYWTFNDGRDSEKENILNAKHLLLQLMLKDVLVKVFRIKINGSNFSDRSSFWKKYIDRIATSAENLGKLDMKYVIRIYSENDSVTTSSIIGANRLPFVKVDYNEDKAKQNAKNNVNGNVAVIMLLNDYSVVEFLEHASGCAYFYKKSSPMYRLIWERKAFSDMKDNKVAPKWTDDDVYSNISTLDSSGRMEHRGEWQQRFRLWLKTHAL